ncbi:MAG: hypothetical protein IJO74_05940 [Clostridia bacterium]|nr:hypothetical protein [Clostridia bacterium]
MRKRFICIFTVLFFILSVNVLGVDQIDNITSAPYVSEDPNIGIVPDAKMPVFQAGKSTVLEIPVRTSSLYTASDVTGYITTPDNQLPFEFENLSPISKPISVFYSIDAKISYDIFVPNNALPGVYPINITVKYKNKMSQDYSKEFVFYIKIENSNFDGSNLDYLSVSNFSVPEYVSPNSSFTAEIELENTSGIDISKATVEIILPSGMNISNDTAVKGGSFSKDKSFTYKFNVLVSNKVESGNLPISFKVIVYDRDNKTIINEFSYESVINIPDDNYYYNPVLEIININVPEKVTAGETFNVSVEYKNTGDCDLKYVRTSLNADINSGTFINKTATSNLIQNISKGESVTHIYTFTASDEIKSDFYSLDFSAKAVYDVSPGEVSEISVTQYSGFYAESILNNLPPYTISDIVIPENVSPGEKIVLTFNINANINLKAFSVDLTLPEGLVNMSQNKFRYDSVAKGSVLAHTVELQCTDDVKENYNIIKISCNTDTYGEIYQYAGIYIYDINDINPGFVISDISIPESVDSSDPSEFKLTFSVTPVNAGADNVNIKVNLPQGIVNRTASVFYADKIEKNKKSFFSVTLYPTKDAPDGFGNIEISVSSRQSESTGIYTGVYVKNKTSGRVDDIPVVIIDEYGYGNDYVLGGSAFPLRLKFLNTSTISGIKDLKIMLVSDEGGVFTPAASSNTYFIQKLAPGESCEWNLDIQTKSDVTPKSYGLIINISYKNEEGTEKTSVETLTIPVRQEMRFNISDLPLINDISMNEDAVVALNCANLGKSTVYNVLIKIQGNFMSSEYEIFAGNIQAGSGYSKNVYLTPTMEGLQEGTVVFQYEDSDGVVTTVEKSISFNAYNDNIEFFPTMMPDDEQFTDNDVNEKQNHVFIWVVAGCIFVTSVIIIAVVINKKKKKKECDDED